MTNETTLKPGNGLVKDGGALGINDTNAVIDLIAEAISDSFGPGWPPDKMRQHIGLIKYRLQMGMCQASFERISSRWRHAESARERQPEYDGAPL